MLTKEEYIDIIDFLDFFYSDNLIATAELRKEKSKELQKEDVMNFKSKLDKLKQLIEEHFYIPPIITVFKLYSDSTFQSFTKKELIKYIHTTYYNWKNACIVNERVIKMNYQLTNELDKLKSNPPLKFEDLKEMVGQPVWNNRLKVWGLVRATGTYLFQGMQQCVLIAYIGEYVDWEDGFLIDTGQWCEFDEDQFYRKQVLDE